MGSTLSGPSVDKATGMDDVKVGIVGTGRMATAHATAWTELEAPPAVCKVLDDRVELRRLVRRAVWRLLGRHHVRVDIRVDLMAVMIAPDRPLDTD